MLCRGVFGSLVAGLIAGILGVTGWGGFLYYLAMQIVVSITTPVNSPSTLQQHIVSALTVHKDETQLADSRLRDTVDMHQFAVLACPVHGFMLTSRVACR